MSHKITTQMMEKSLAQKRAVEVYKNQLKEFSSESAKLMYVAKAQEKVEQKRRQAYHNACELEHQYEANKEMEAYQKRSTQRAAAMNLALAEELDRENSELSRKKTEIQRICDDAPELRELERMLKIAYMNKERTVQHREKIAIAETEASRIKAMEDEIEERQKLQIKAEEAKLAEKKRQLQAQGDVIKRQIEERKAAVEEAKKQAELDREMVEEIVKKVEEEDRREVEKRRQSQIETERMMKEYARQHALEMEAKRKADQEEEDRIMSYQKAVLARDEGVAAKKQAKKDEEDRILAQIVAESERKRLEEEEFNNLRDMLWEEELEEKRRKEAEDRVQKAHRMREEMMEANKAIMRGKEEQRRAEIQEEARLVAVMKKKFQDDEARERAEEKAKRDAKIHHLTLIDKQKQDMQRIHEAEREAENQEEIEFNEREAYRKIVIQEARKRLLAEHAAKLQGYLPGTAFANKDELDYFRKVGQS